MIPVDIFTPALKCRNRTEGSFVVACVQESSKVITILAAQFSIRASVTVRLECAEVTGDPFVEIVSMNLSVTGNPINKLECFIEQYNFVKEQYEQYEVLAQDFPQGLIKRRKYRLKNSAALRFLRLQSSAIIVKVLLTRSSYPTKNLVQEPTNCVPASAICDMCNSITTWKTSALKFRAKNRLE